MRHWFGAWPPPTTCWSPSKRGPCWAVPARHVFEALTAHGSLVPMVQLGLPDRFIDHGEAAQQLGACGLDSDGIAASIRRAAKAHLGQAPLSATPRQRSA